MNDLKQSIGITPGSYISLNRDWKNGNRIRLVFQYSLYLKAMPDDKNVVALFYGPVLMAFESTNELILKGSQQEMLNSLKLTNEGRLNFTLQNDGNTYTLRPLYDIEDQSYGVYATFREY